MIGSGLPGAPAYDMPNFYAAYPPSAPAYPSQSLIDAAAAKNDKKGKSVIKPSHKNDESVIGSVLDADKKVVIDAVVGTAAGVTLGTAAGVTKTGNKNNKSVIKSVLKHAKSEIKSVIYANKNDEHVVNSVLKFVKAVVKSVVANNKNDKRVIESVLKFAKLKEEMVRNEKCKFDEKAMTDSALASVGRVGSHIVDQDVLNNVCLFCHAQL